jgi:signal transduction histidine kinase
VLTSASGLISLFIGMYVLLKGPRKLVNQLFFLLTFFMALWALGEAMTISSVSLEDKVFWTKFQVFGEAPLVPTYLLIALCFPRPKRIMEKRGGAAALIAAIYAPFVLIAALLYTTDLVYPRYSLADNMSGVKVTQSATFWVVTAIGFCEILAATALYLWERHRNPSRVARMGLLVMALAPLPMLAANLVQGIWHDPHITTPQAGFIFMAIIGIGIMRYGIFVDIRSVTKRLAVHCAVIVANLSVFSLLCALYVYVLGLDAGWPTYALFVLTGIPFMINYQAEVDWARRVADRFISGRELEERRLLQELSRSIRTVRNLGELAESVVYEVRESMSLTACALLLREEHCFKLISYASQPISFADIPEGVVDKEVRLWKWGNLFSFDDHKGTYSGCWQLEDEIVRGEAVLYRIGRGVMRLYLGDGDLRERLWSDSEGETIAVPLQVGGEEVGLLFLVARPVRFSLEELDFIIALSTQVAVSLRNAQLLQELLDKSNRLQELVQSYTTAQEEERMKISRELHDGLAPFFLDIIYRLETLEGKLDGSSSLALSLQEVKEKAREGLRDLREVIGDLRPSSLDVLGLEKVLATYLERFGLENGVEVEFEPRGGLGKLDPLLEVTFFRVAQEALSNISRHAHARKVRLFIGKNDGRLEMVVEDDGVGFVEREVRERINSGRCLGIRGMSERAELVRGSLRVESRPNGGTRIVLSVPHGGA